MTGFNQLPRTEAGTTMPSAKTIHNQDMARLNDAKYGSEALRLAILRYFARAGS